MKPHYKEPVKQETDKMLDVGLIYLVKESDWISLIVKQGNKTGEIHICVYFHGLYEAYVHDPFPTSFSV